jgi:hypothetical protein
MDESKRLAVQFLEKEIKAYIALTLAYTRGNSATGRAPFVPDARA